MLQKFCVQIQIKMFKLCAIQALISSLIVKILAQSTSDAYVKIVNSQGLSAGQLGIYEFTVEVYSGTLIQIYLPNQLSYSGDTSKVTTCYEKQLGDLNIQPLTNCTFNLTLNMVQFSIPQDYQNGGYLSVGIGSFLNPPQSMLLNGFSIQIFDATNNLISQSDPAAVQVQILPNVLTQQRLQVGSNQIAAQTSYLFSFQVTNPVPANGGIQLIFPTTEIPIPLTAPSAQISLDGGNIWTTVQTTQITQTSLTFGLLTRIAANGVVQLNVNQLTNPNTMAQTLSFVISTIGIDQGIIDQVTTGLTVTCTVPATLNITSIAISSRTVGVTTSATFRLSLPIRYQNGGYLLINTPSTVSFNSSSLLCLLLIGFVSDIGQCSLQNATQLKIFDTINQPQLTFSVSGIQNPSNTQPTSNFLIQAYDPLGNLIASNLATPSFGYTPTPGAILSASSIRSINIVGQPTNITISFRNQNTLQTGQLIQVIIPLSHFLVTNDVITCQAGTQSDSTNSQVSCSQQVSTSSITLIYSVNCASRPFGQCSSGTQFTLIVSGMQNLFWISTNTQSVQITTMTNDQLYLIDQIRTGINSLPSLIAGSLKNLTLANTPGGVVGAQTRLQVSLLTQNQIPAGGYVTLQLQDQSFQPPSSGSLLCTSQSQSLTCSLTKFTSGYINTITINQPWGNTAISPSGSIISFDISQLLNPKSVSPIPNQFTFSTFTSQNQLIDQGILTGATGLQIEVANITSLILLQPLSTQIIKTGSNTTYQIQIIPNNGIEPNLGKLIIEIPTEISLKFSSCSAVAQQSVQILSCQISGQTLQITHSFTNTNFASQKIVVTGNNIINPTTTKPSQFLSAYIYLQASSISPTLYMVEQVQNSFNIIANTPNQLTEAIVTRSFAQVNSPTSVTICFTPYNPLFVQSTLTITFPQDQIVIGTGVLTSNATIKSFSGQQIVFQFLQAQNAGQQACFMLSGNITNAQSTKHSVTSIQILTQTVDGHLIDQMSENLFTTPFISSGPFQSIQITQQNFVVGQATNVQIVLQLSTQLIFGNTLQIIFPTSTFYISDSMQCVFQQQNQNCLNFTSQNDTIGTFYTSIYLLIPNSYLTGQTLNFTVENLVNKYNSNPIQALIIVVASDAFGNAISRSQQNLNITLTPNSLGTLKASRSQLTVQKNTNFNIVANLQTRLHANSQVQVSLAQSLISSASNPQVLLNNTLVSTQMTQTTDNYLITFFVPFLADKSILNITILGFQNWYSTDSTSGGIHLQTSISGYQVDNINVTQMSDLLTATTTNFSSFSLKNNIVGQKTTLQLNLNIAGYAAQNNIVRITNISQSFYKSGEFQLLYNGNEVQSQSSTDLNQYLTSVTFSLPSICQTTCTLSLSNLINNDDTAPLNLYYTISIYTTQGGIVAFGNSQFLNQNVLMPPLIEVQFLNRSSQLPAKNTKIQLAFTLPNVKNVPQDAILYLIMPVTDIDIVTPGICQTDYPQECLISQFNTTHVQLQVSNFCFNGCYGGQSMTINILNGLINPASIQVSNFKYQFQLFSASNSLIAQTIGGFQLQPNLQMNITMGQVSIGSLVNQIVGSLATLQINIVLAVELQLGTLIQINLPASTFYTSDSLFCQEQQCKNTTTQNDQIGIYYTSITLLTTQAYEFGQTLTIILQNLMNKFNKLSVVQNSVQVTVQNAFGSATCQSSGNISITYQPNQLGTVIVTRSQLEVQQATTIVLQVNLQTRLQQNSQVTITIPKSTFVQTQTQKISLNGAQITSTISQNATSYILNFNVQAMTDLSVLSITVSGFTNRYSTDLQSEGISIQTSIQGNLVDVIPQTQLTDSLLPTAASISSYNLSNTFVGQTTTLGVQLQISGYAQQNDVVVLKFLEQNNYVAGLVGANFNGQQVQSTSKQDEKGYLSSLTFLLPSKLQNQALVQVTGLINRDTTQPINFSFDVQIISNAGGLIAVGQSQFMNQNVLQPTTFVVSSLTRNSQIPGNPIQLSLNLILPSVVNIPNDVQLSLFIPSSDMQIDATLSYTNTEAICTFVNLNNSFISLILTDICKQGCKSGSSQQITIYSGILNQLNSLVTNLPYHFQISSNGYLIAQQVGGVVIQPPLIQDVRIQNLSLQQTSITAADYTTFSMSFAFDYNITQAKFVQIGIPSQTFILDEKTVPQCLLYGQQSTACTITQQQTFSDSPISVTMIQFNISSGNFTGNVNQTIVLNGFRNIDTPRLRKADNMFSLTVINSVGSIISSSLASESQLPEFTVASITNFNVTRSTLQTGQKGVSYQFQFQVQNFIRPGEFFQITLPLDQAQIDSSMLLCRDATTGYNVLCQILLGQQILQVNQWCYIKNNQKSHLCQPNVTMNLQVILSNPSTFSAYQNPVTLNLFTQEANLKATNLTGTFVSPSLTGITLNSVTLQRLNNTIGTKDTLQLSIGSIDTSIIVSTDLILNLADGTQFQSTQQNISCFRNVAQKNSQLVCYVSKTFISGSIQQITIKNFCSQSLLCLKNQTFIVDIKNVLNPSTNQIIISSQTWMALQQGIIEVAIRNITSSLVKMLPASVYISTTVSNNCTTMTTCQLNVTLFLTNSLQAGSFVTFVSPLSFQNFSCKIQSVLIPINCIIVNTNTIKLVGVSFVSNTTPLKFTIAQVSMPLTTASITNFYVTSYETVNGVSSILDQSTGGNITVIASQFAQLSVIRLKSTLGSTTDIQIQFSNPQQVPNSTFTINFPNTQAILQSQSKCSSSNIITVQCNISQQIVTIRGLRNFCPFTAQVCKLTISNVINPNGVFIGQGSQQFVQFQLLSNIAQNGVFYQILQSFQNITPSLAQQNFTIFNALIQPTNSYTAQPIKISFEYALQQGPGQFMQIRFDKTRYAPIYSELQEVQVQINNQVVEIVNIKLVQTGWYWAPVQELTFSLPTDSFGKTSKVVLSGLSNPQMQNNQNNKAILNVMYLFSDLSALASSSIVIPVYMVPSLVSPITVYSQSPYVATQTYIDVSFGLQNNTVYLGNISIQLPQAFQLQNILNCSELLSLKNITCNAQTQNTVVIPFNQTQSYTGFSFRIGPITNPVAESTGQVKIMIYDSQGTYSQGSFDLIAYQQGNFCNENCQKCTSSGVCTSCSQGFVLNGDSCSLVCPKGQFALQSQCFQCQSQCLACQRQDQCSVCYSDQVILSGLCLQSCPNGYVADSQSQCQIQKTDSESSCNGQARQTYTQNTVNDASSTTSTNITFALQQAGINQTNNPFFFCQNALNQTACTAQNCSNCGLVSSVCQVCEKDMVIFDGTCVSNCPNGYFLFDQQCYKCSSACLNCLGTASNCIDCKDGLLYSPKYGQCQKGCSSGYYYQQSNKSCISCDSKCNTCEISSNNCTSCLVDTQTNADMFLSQGTCVTRCPTLQYENLATHECIKSELATSSLIWCLPLCFTALIISFGCAIFVKGKASLLSLNTVQVATALITTFDFLNKLGLLISLWPSQNLGSFVVIGINILLTSLLGIYESHVVQVSGRPRLLKIISQIAGPQITRLFLSNFLAIFKINLPTPQQPVQTSQQYERCCIAQSVLVVIQMLNSVAIVALSSPQQSQFGLAVNSLILGSVSLILTAIIIRNSRVAPILAKQIAT